MKARAARDSGQVVIARRAGVVTSVTGGADPGRRGLGRDEYKFLQFVRSNQGTCIDQRPIVTVGQRVEDGDPIADSARRRAARSRSAGTSSWRS